MNYHSLSHKDLLKIIDKVRDKVKKSNTYLDLCKENGLKSDFIDLVPMSFADLNVSARTDKGCIYFNYSLLNDGDFESDDHYMLHELQHFVDQCYGEGPTTSSANSEDYLDNEFEQRGFQTQTEYLSETRGPEFAEVYIDKVLNHHNINNKEKEKRKKDLLQLSSLITNIKVS